MKFHILFSILCIGFLMIRIVYHRKAGSSKKSVEFGESKWNMIFRAVIGFGYVALLLGYIFYPPILVWAVFPLPSWIRWIGLVITSMSVVLIWWVQWALGVQFNTTLHIQESHQLVSHGPYRWERHPMYTELLLMGVRWLLLTRNWFVGGGLISGILVVIVSRVKKEESLMIDTFGASYADYIQRTGRFLLRIF